MLLIVKYSLLLSLIRLKRVTNLMFDKYLLMNWVMQQYINKPNIITLFENISLSASFCIYGHNLKS